MAKTRKSEKLEKPVWLKYSETEVKELILKLSEKGLTSEKIGLTLRDQYGIPKVSIYGLKIRKVLEEKGKFIEPTNINLKGRIENLNGHRKTHIHDQSAKRALTIAESHLKKREEYKNRN
jgi:ribosomal protein S15P/S13E